jgi:hypothetical protein
MQNIMVVEACGRDNSPGSQELIDGDEKTGNKIYPSKAHLQ